MPAYDKHAGDARNRVGKLESSGTVNQAELRRTSRQPCTQKDLGNPALYFDGKNMGQKAGFLLSGRILSDIQQRLARAMKRRKLVLTPVCDSYPCKPQKVRV
jgi:hypothetical protein